MSHESAAPTASVASVLSPLPAAPDDLESLFTQVRGLIDDAEQLCTEFEAELSVIPQSHQASATNLIHYVALRRKDIRALQVALAGWGLSSLGRLEGHVMAGLVSVANALAKLLGRPPIKEAPQFREGDATLDHHTNALFGPRHREHAVRIMVTLGSDAAQDQKLVESLVRGGMDIARINTAHDDDKVWEAMISNVHAAAQSTGRACRILMDLEGPKLRTGAMAPGPRVLHIGVTRDARGIVTAPTVVKVVANLSGSGAELPVPSLLWSELQAGDSLTFKDIPGRQRELTIVDRRESIVFAQTKQAFFVEPGIRIAQMRDGKVLGIGEVGEIPPTETVIHLLPGERFVLAGPAHLGRPVQRNTETVQPAVMPCTLPEVFREVSINDRIFFDDGKIAGVVCDATPEALQIEVERTPPNGGKLGADKGINLPDTASRLPALSEDDLRHLDFATAHADIIGLSFVRTRQDIERLYQELDRRGAGHLGVVLKIETKRGFENLPDLLLAALMRPAVGVMVARGDLGVEMGFERMAEVQEQILWLCEAAHVPVVWATQVLETLNKKGAPTRGEVTDAAMSARAECVMLNKGPHVVEAVRFLADILVRMQDHHQKKTPMLRKLKVSEGRWQPT